LAYLSAILRQPASVSRKEKVAYVDEVIKLLGMEAYADAVFGVPGEGLSVEQRKRLTIGAELAAKPQLLLFLDEPTSGLDSQTSWSILNLIDTLTKHGQAILALSINHRLCYSSASIDYSSWRKTGKPYTSVISARIPRFCRVTSSGIEQRV
jgi:ABC-type multidrug transport system ATPase subunit